MNVVTILIIYILFVNIIGFALMGIDKYKAKKRAFRIPEVTLFIIAIIGGSIGSILGMKIFRHKTRHRSFFLGMPAILTVQVLMIIFILNAPISIKIL